MPKRFSITKRILTNPLFYGVTLIFTVFIVAHATFVVTTGIAPYFFYLALVAIGVLTVEQVLAKARSLNFKYYRPRYKIIIGLGMSTSIIVAFSDSIGAIGLIAPLLLFRVYHSLCKAISDQFSRTLDIAYLTLSFMAVPLALLLGYFDGTTGFVLIYSFAITSTLFSLVGETIAKSSGIASDLTEANSYLYQSSLSLINDLVSDTLIESEAELKNRGGNDQDPTNKKITKQVLRARSPVDKTSGSPSIKKYLHRLHDLYKEKKHRIVYTGWEDNITSPQAVIVLSLIKYFISYTDSVASGKRKEETVTWVTHTPGRVSIRDNWGKNVPQPEGDITMDPDLGLIAAFTSEEFYKIHKVKTIYVPIFVEGKYTGMETIILF